MKAVFMDRDGTLIKEPADERVENVDEIELFSDTIEALKLLDQNGYSIVIVSNQAGIGEGLITDGEFIVINAEIEKMLATR